MIAENKQEFFEQLGRELEKLGVEDKAELMSDLEEHFAEGERRGESEGDICRELGNIAEIARSCLDLKSTAINSMVARDVKRKKGVSLTKPGRSVPADPTLSAPRNSEATSEEAAAAEEDCVRSFTPEHIREEVVPGSTPTASSENASAESPSPENATADGTSVGSSSPAGADSSANVKTGSAPPQGGPSGSPGGGVFEKIGKTVDEVCEKTGKALNNAFNKAGTAVNNAAGKAAQPFRPSDDYRKSFNKNRGGNEIPPQNVKVKTKKGGSFVDTSGLTPNVNAARLGFEIVLDIILWIWLIVLMFALMAAAFAVSMAMIFAAVACAIGTVEFGMFKPPTRVLFATGFICLSGAMFCLTGMLGKAAVSLSKHVIGRHVKAVYDI